MPLPMRPEPSTPTVLMSLINTPDSGGLQLERLLDLVRDAAQRVGARTGQRVVRANLAALEAVEHLLQADFHTRRETTVRPRQRQTPQAASRRRHEPHRLGRPDPEAPRHGRD